MSEPEVGEAETERQVAEEAAGKAGPGFSRLIENIANLAGFYGQGIRAESEVRIDVPAAEARSNPQAEEPVESPPAEPADAPLEAATTDQADGVEPEQAPAEPAVGAIVTAPDEGMAAQPAPDEPGPAHDPAPALEGKLQDRLSEVRAIADEARQAQIRATQALHEGLSAAYDFALDAETSPEDYLRLVEAKGMKIQLRAPMAPVARLAFDGVCDAGTIQQFEAVLAWALKEELPRGALIERIASAGGISELLEGV